jgi:hypothetical protein
LASVSRSPPLSFYELEKWAEKSKKNVAELKMKFEKL